MNACNPKSVVFKAISTLILTFLVTGNIRAENMDMDLNTAIKKALDYKPNLQSAENDVEISVLNVSKSGLLNNPELEVEVENFGGSGNFSGFDESEAMMKLSQTFELWGKRGRKKRIAEMGNAYSLKKLENRKSFIIHQTTLKYIEVLKNIEKLHILESNLDLNTKSLKMIEDLVIAGKKPKSDERRARIELFKYSLKKKQVESELDNSIIDLMNMWGEKDSGAINFAGNLDINNNLPEASYFLRHMKNSPIINEIENLSAIIEEQVRLKKSERLPDLSLSGGIKKFRGSDESAYILGVGVELPLFDRKNFDVSIKKIELDKINIHGENSKLSLEAELTKIHNQLKTKLEEINLFNNSILPLSQQEFDSVKDSYKEGRHSFMDVMDAMTVLFDTKSLLAESLAEYHVLLSDIRYKSGLNLTVRE